MSAFASPGKLLTQLTGLKVGKGSAFNGCMIAVNEISPPLILPFSFSPVEITDDVHPEYDHVSSPGGAHKFPIFMGMSEHKVTFSLIFDAKYPTVMAGDGSDALNNSEGVCQTSTSADTGTTYSTRNGSSRSGHLGPGLKMFYIDSVIARLEKMKMPRNALSRLQMAGSFTPLLAPPDAAEPAPPLILLATSLNKFYLGYLDNTIRQTQFNKYMLPTRIEVDCTFYTSPDMICTNLAEVYRTAMALVGIGTAFQS